MKKIHFGNLKRNGNRILIVFSILGLFLIVNGTFEIIEFENTKINSYLSLNGQLIVTILISQIFWYQNYVQWNKRGIFIKIKSFLGKNFEFKEIKSSELIHKKLIITETFGNTIEIDLSHILESDAIKLHKIINEHTIPIKINPNLAS